MAAHPDDEVLGCGGTISKMRAGNVPVTIVILGEGITSRKNIPVEKQKELLEALHEDARKAGAILGVEDVRLFNLPDNRFDQVPLLEIVHVLEGVIQDIKPTVVFTQHGGDLNVDHVQTFRATMTATRPMAGTSVRTLLSYEVASSTEWAFQQFSPAFHPSVFVDIDGFVDSKINAMTAYESEKRQPPHPRAEESLRAAAVYWGKAASMMAAEPFHLVRALA